MKLKFTPYFVFCAALAAFLIALGPSRRGAGTSARPSHSEPCGGPPNYCANSTRQLVPETPMAPPPVNTPFRDPDFSSRMVRVTDASTLAGTPGRGSSLTGISFHTDSSGEQNEWSAFDPHLGEHGGYRFWVDGAGGASVLFAFDPVTMRVTKVTNHKRGHRNLGKPGLLPIASSFSYKDPDIIYGTRGTQVLQYNLVTGKMARIYDFARCPGMPEHMIRNMHFGGLTISGDDTKFAYMFGGWEQDMSKLAVFYDRSAGGGAGACYWYDSKMGTTGGTNMPPARIAGGVGKLTTPDAPKVTAEPGSGSLPAGDYYVKITAVSRLDQGFGETRPSAEVGPVHLASAGGLKVIFPRLSNPYALWLPPKNSGCLSNGPHCRPFKVYIGASPGAEKLQNTKGFAGGRAYTQSTPLKSGSSSPSDESTAGYTMHDARISKSGRVVRVEEAFSATEYFWTPGTTRVVPCLRSMPNKLIAGYCGGHLALGYSHMVNATGFFDDMGVVIHSLSNLRDWRLLVSPVPNPPEWSESTHWSWSDADPSDTMPVCGALYVDAIVKGGDGTQNIQTNPVLQIHRAWDREIVCLATTGPSRVWRFAHDRATGTSNDNAPINTAFWSVPIGNVSQDGKFYLFSTDWEWSLGSRRGSEGCPSRGACRTDVFIVELH
jgi:hypothetical protein